MEPANAYETGKMKISHSGAFPISSSDRLCLIVFMHMDYSLSAEDDLDQVQGSKCLDTNSAVPANISASGVG